MNKRARSLTSRAAVSLLAILATLGAASVVLARLPYQPLPPPENPETLSGGQGYTVVYSSTTPALLNVDGLPTRRYFEVRSDGSRYRLYEGKSTSDLHSLSGMVRHMTGTDSYFPEVGLTSHEDELTLWSDPRGTNTYETSATALLESREVEGWDEIQTYINTNDLTYLGEEVRCGDLVKGARYTEGTLEEEAWFAELGSDLAVRLEYRRTDCSDLKDLEECVTATLGQELSESDFELVKPTLWATHTLTISTINVNPPPSVHDYNPLLMSSSSSFTNLHAFVVDRSYEGVFSFEFNSWPPNSLTPGAGDQVGWIVVQDVEDTTGQLVRVVQNKAGIPAPFRHTGLEAFDPRSNPPPPSSAYQITVPGSTNPVIRDYIDEGMARWSDSVGGGNFAFLFREGGHKSDEYIRGLVTELMNSRP